MPDVARTLADMKTLLADNNTGAISPQDLRDMLESIVNPIPASGMYNGLFNSSPSPTVLNPTISTPNNVVVPLPLGNAMQGFATGLGVHDPEGWFDHTYTLVGTDPKNTWATTWPIGHALKLPPGLYMGFVTGRYTTVPEFSESPAKYVYVIFDQAEYDPTWPAGYDITPDKGWMYGNYYNPDVFGDMPAVGFSIQPTVSKYFTSVHLLVNDADVSKPFILIGWAVGQGVTRELDYYGLKLVKIA